MRASTKLVAVVGLALAVGLATAAAPFASPSPDGLERVAAEQGFLERGQVHAVQDSSPLPGYAVPGVGNEKLATGLAGFAGTLAVFAIGSGLALLLRRRAGRAGAGDAAPGGPAPPD